MHGMILWIIAKLYESHCLFAFNKSGHLHLTTYHGFLQTGYSVVAASVVALRLKDKASSQVSSTSWKEGVTCLFIVACSGFGAGVFYRFNTSFTFMVIAVIVAILASCSLCFRQVSNQMYILNLIGCRLIVLLVEKKIKREGKL